MTDRLAGRLDHGVQVRVFHYRKRGLGAARVLREGSGLHAEVVLHGADPHHIRPVPRVRVHRQGGRCLPQVASHTARAPQTAEGQGLRDAGELVLRRVEPHVHLPRPEGAGSPPGTGYAVLLEQ